MGYNTQLRCLEGEAALAPGPWAAGVLVEFLTAALTDPEAAHAAAWGFSAERTPLVTLDAARAAAFFAAAGRMAEPVGAVLVLPGATLAQSWEVAVAGQTTPGLRHQLELELDVAWPLQQAAAGPTAFSFAALVCTCLQAGRPLLETRGLFNCQVKQESPRPEAAEGRHRIRVGCLVRSLLQ